MAHRADDRPVVTSLSRASGDILGGQKVVIHGDNLDQHPVVTFGTQRATVLTSTQHKLKVRTPAGLAGVTRLRVRTAGGQAANRPRFTYEAPAASDASSVTPADGTFVATDADWVSGGPDPADPVGTHGTPYVVGLPAGASAPSDGQAFYLAPSLSPYRPGVAGTVSEIAYQPDGTVRVTVAGAPLGDVLEEGHISYASPVDLGDARRRSGSSDSQELRAGAFECEDNFGEERSFSGKLSLELTDLKTYVDLDFGLFSGYSAKAILTGAVTIKGTVTADNSLECKLSSAWQDAHRRIIPVGSSGATLSFAPSASFKISSGGEFSLSQTTHFEYGANKEKHGSWQAVHVAQDDPPKVGGSARLKLTADAGIQVRLGYLDAVGADVDAVLEAEGTLELKAGRSLNLCASVAFSVKLKIGAFYDIRISHGHLDLADLSLELKKFEACVLPDEPEPDGDPIITSSTLPDATAGSEYAAQLETSDGRLGFWSITDGSLPPGLSMDDAGLITGTPAVGGIGRHQVGVRFTDSDNRQDIGRIAINVLPSDGVGGGVIQATLTWSGTADLDLHAIEPDDNEVYYGNTGPSANGGELDTDANAGCGSVAPAPAENIRWNGEQTAAGAYAFFVNVYDDCGSSDLAWHLVVRVGGHVVVDETGYGDSDTVVVNYGSGRTRVTTHPTAVEPREPK